MRKIICGLLVTGMLFAASPQAEAADLNLHFAREEEGWIGEIWYDHALLWQLAFLPSGALPVSTGAAKLRTIITPDFENGFFLFRVK